MERSPVSVNLSPKRKDLFNAILASGPEGLDTTTLVDMFFDDSTKDRIGGYTTLRTTIHAINNEISPLRIVARGGSYRIIKLR